MDKTLTAREAAQINAFLAVAEELSDTIDEEGNVALLEVVNACQRRLRLSLSERNKHGNFRLIAGGKC